MQSTQKKIKQNRMTKTKKNPETKKYFLTLLDILIYIQYI